MNLVYGVIAVFALSWLFVSSADAQTYKVYVQQMPQIWQKTFGDVLPSAIQYWKQKNPDIVIETVRHSDQSNFVIEWASQFDASKTGHYSTDQNNHYDKPKFTVPLGYIKNNKLKTVSPEFAIEITKHNLGHAIGMQHSDNPGDAMYPQIENYESWLQTNSKIMPKDNTKSVDSKPNAEKIQASSIKKLNSAKAAFEKLLPSVNSTWTTNKGSQAEMLKAQDLVFVAKRLLSDAESFLAQGDISFSEAKYQDSYYSYKNALDKAKKLDGKTVEIKKIIKKAIQLESVK